MTAYFDDVHTAVRAVPAGREWDELPGIEERLVHDCSVAAEFPGFPGDLRDCIDRVVMLKGIATRPTCLPPFDCETVEQHRAAVNDLAWDLHSIFHEVAHRGLQGFSDSPLLPVRALACRAEERRDDDAAAVVLFRRVLLPMLLEGTMP